MAKLNKMVSRRNGLVIGILAAVLILLGTAFGDVSAKYVKDAGDQKAVVRAKEFYFSSNLLKENGASYSLNPGTKSITFELKNHDDSLRYSEEKITFTVDSGNAKATYEPNELTGSKISTVTVTLSGLEDGQTYTVKAIGDGGYKKELYATFEVKTPGTNVYKHLAADPSGAFVLLTVWTENVTGAVTINFPAGLIPDATDGALTGIQNYKDGKYIANTSESGISNAAGTMGVYSSHTYRFFLEQNFTNYTIEDFTVIVGGTSAVASIPN